MWRGGQRRGVDLDLVLHAALDHAVGHVRARLDHHPRRIDVQQTGFQPEQAAAAPQYVHAEQVARLQSEGFEDFHFYTLNQADLAPAVCRLLCVRPQRERVDAA